MIVQLNTSTLQLSVDYWKQERLIFSVPTGAGDGISVWSDLDSNLAHYVGYGSTALIDLTDYARANADNLSTIYIYSDWNGDTWEIDFSVAGLISPDSVLIPPTPNASFSILPPSKFLVDGTNILMTEINNLNATPIIASKSRWSYYDGSNWAADSGLGKGLYPLTIQPTWTQLRFNGRSMGGINYISLVPVSCGIQYAVVEWVSFTGKTRRHIFEVVKQKTNVREPYSLMPTDMEYIEVKGREDGFTLRLDGLDRYDLWYYSDLITSSNVQVNLGSGYTRVQVVSKSITLPDGEAGTNGVLEVQINWKRYDAVSM